MADLRSLNESQLSTITDASLSKLPDTTPTVYPVAGKATPKCRTKGTLTVVKKTA